SPGGSHPRSAGTFARFIQEFVVARPLLPIEEAVRKATSLPASILGIADRGTIREGAKADMLLLDPAKVRGRAEHVHPKTLAECFDLVLVNGQPAFENGEAVVRAGHLLRRGA